jgi:hypothetical protein
MDDEPAASLTATGGCLCGAVRYEARAPLRDVVNCHCGQCLKTHGNFAAYSAVPRAGLHVVEAADVAWYRSSAAARRGFCRVCGSSLFWDPEQLDYVALAAGSIDRPTGLKTVRHIFVEDKSDFYEISDDLAQISRGQAD